jgi:hypothetical protein
MQFVKPMPFVEAVDKLGLRSPIGSTLSSSEWRDVPVALRERAFFSSRVESVRFLQRGRDSLADFLQGARETLPTGEIALKTGSRQEFVKQLQQFALEEGMGPLDPKDAGTIKDITSQRRLELIFDTQTRQAQDFGYWKQGQDADVLNEFPAQRFIRVQDVETPRDWHVQFEDQVRLKSDVEFWSTINRDFGVPWGPWGWGCGHDVEDVDRDEAERLGLIRPGEKPASAEPKFNERLESSAMGLDQDLVHALQRGLARAIEIVGNVIRWARS